VTLDEHFASLHIEAKPGSYVVIGIEDSGSGIAPELMEKIFEPFFTTKEFGKGTGLGLSTSLAVVKSHSGFMSVYSEVGQGTSFKLYFPAMTAENSVSKESDRPTLPLGHGELVMVVDDEFAVRQITCQTLEAYGYRVILAADGSEALSLFAVQQNDISLVITDMMMPVMDGNATIRVLTRMRPSVRIIAASGLNENHVIAKAMSNGVKHFLAKPYTAESLLTKIYEALM
jgi:CheY-like chemotaxis protein